MSRSWPHTACFRSKMKRRRKARPIELSSRVPMPYITVPLHNKSPSRSRPCRKNPLGSRSHRYPTSCHDIPSTEKTKSRKREQKQKRTPYMRPPTSVSFLVCALRQVENRFCLSLSCSCSHSRRHQIPQTEGNQRYRDNDD